MRRTSVMVLALTAILGTAGVAEASVESRTDLRTTLQRDADRLLDYGAPGVLVGLVDRNQEITVRSGFGNVEEQTPVPWEAKFRIGSYTKTFVSATLLQLVGEGRLSLDDTVDRWLPGVVNGNGNDGRTISVRQVLQQTTGLPDYLQGMLYMWDPEGFEQHRFDSLTAQEAVALAMTFKREFPPGTQWNYSNTNYMLAGMIIDRVTGNTWQHEVQKRIIRPLGLRDTYTPGTSPYVPRPHAIGYERFPGPDATPEDPKYGEPIDATLLNPSWGGAAGEMISTTDDGNRFLRALMSGKVLRPAQLAEMRTTVRTNAGFEQNWPGIRYGLGLMSVPTSCGISWAHGGDIHGFKTRNGVTADGSRSVFVSINTDSMVPEPGVPAPTKDVSIDLIDHALCGTR